MEIPTPAARKAGKPDLAPAVQNSLVTADSTDLFNLYFQIMK